MRTVTNDCDSMDLFDGSIDVVKRLYIEPLKALK